MIRLGARRGTAVRSAGHEAPRRGRHRVGRAAQPDHLSNGGVSPSTRVEDASAGNHNNGWRASAAYRDFVVYLRVQEWTDHAEFFDDQEGYACKVNTLDSGDKATLVLRMYDGGEGHAATTLDESAPGLALTAASSSTGRSGHATSDARVVEMPAPGVRSAAERGAPAASR